MKSPAKIGLFPWNGQHSTRNSRQTSEIDLRSCAGEQKGLTGRLKPLTVGIGAVLTCICVFTVKSSVNVSWLCRV